jgi:hypothetical protein
MPTDLEWLIETMMEELTELDIAEASDGELLALQRQCERWGTSARYEREARAKARAAQLSLLPTMEVSA